MAPSSNRTLSILIIGPSQNGKTTFINRMCSLALNKVEKGEEGNRDFKCTTISKVYELDLPLSDYIMIDKQTGQVFNPPDLSTDEDKVLKGWRRMTTSKYALELRDRRGPVVKIRLIDTPGLDDSEGKDFENMENVLEMLNHLGQSEKAWEREIHAIVLVYNANNAFSASFQSIVHDYYNCMPNLFGGLSVVNTNFSLTTLSEKRSHLLRDKLLGAPTDNARGRIVAERTTDFKNALGRDLTVSHFFLDSKPRPDNAYTEFISRNTICDIVEFWMSSRSMPIKQMRLVKNKTMAGIDKRLQRYLQTAIDRWTLELRETQKSASMDQAFRSTLLQRKEELTNSIARREMDLERWDNETQYALQTYTTADDPSVAELFFNSIFRRRIKNSLKISQPNYDYFDVTAEDSTRATWVSKRLDPGSRTWTGEYEGVPGKAPNLVARAYTTNRVVYRQDIARLKSEMRVDRSNLADNQAQWDERFNSDESQPKSSVDVKLETLGKQIEAAKNLVKVLEHPNPPMDVAFNEASRTRYKKAVPDVNMQDLLDFVRAARLDVDLVKPLRRELDDD
jgi:GTPase SAR1 family protein